MHKVKMKAQAKNREKEKKKEKAQLLGHHRQSSQGRKPFFCVAFGSGVNTKPPQYYFLFFLFYFIPLSGKHTRVDVSHSRRNNGSV